MVNKYKNLDKFICDKFYYIEYKQTYSTKGYLLNYYWGNIVLLTPKGVIHLTYKDLDCMYPIKKPSDELLKMVEEITENR